MSRQSDRLEQQIKSLKKLLQSAATSGDENNQRENKKNETGTDTKNPNQEIRVIEQNPLFDLVLIFLGEVGAFIAWILADFFSSSIWLSGYLFFFAIFFLTGFGVHKTIKSESFQAKYKKYGRYVWIGFGLILIAGIMGFSVALKAASKNIQGALNEKKHDRQTISEMKTQIAALYLKLTNNPTDESGNPIGLLLPANDPMPDEGWAPSNCCFLIFGGNVCAALSNSIIPAIRFHDTDILQIGMNDKGAFICGRFFNKDGKLVAILETNEWTLNRLNYFRKFIDKSTLTVSDEENKQVLNVRFCNRNIFQISGIIRFSDSSAVDITTNYLEYNSGSFSGARVTRNKAISSGGFVVSQYGIGWGIEVPPPH